MFELFYGLIGLAVFFFLAGSAILPWLHRKRLAALTAQVERLTDELDRLRQRISLASVAAHTAPVQATEPTTPAAPTLPTRSALPNVAESIPEIGEVPEPVTTAHPTQSRRSFEQQFGARLPVWIGGIALALAGFYFVRYSIEVGLLGPLARVILGLFFGAGLIAAAHKFGPRQARIGQALAGAGIADLYICLFAATSLYNLFPQLIGFIGMVGVTALAMLLALRHGMPIAIMGLVGGFITPLLVDSDSPNTPLLLTYLYLLFTALLWVIRRQRWWILALLLAPFVLLWAVLVLLTAPASEAAFIALFLLAIGATLVTATHGTSESGARHAFGLTTAAIIKGLSGLVVCVGAILIGVATAKGGFSWLDRGLLLTLTAGGIGLAWLDYTRYRYAPWLTLVVSLCTLASWSNASQLEVGLTLALFAGLHAFAATVLLWRSAQPLFWSLLATISATLFYLLAYARMGWQFDRITLWPYIEPKFWGGLALVLACVAVSQAARIYKLSWASEELRQKLLAAFAATASGFIALGLTIELDKEFLTVALAAEVAALAWLRLQLNVTALRWLAGAAALCFALLLLPQLLLLFQLSAYSLFEARLYVQDNLPLVRWPLFQLGVPAALLIAASLWLRRQQDGKLVRLLEVGNIALIGIMGYYLMRHAFHPGENVLFAKKAGFIERGAFTNALLVFGLICLWLAQRYNRSAVAMAGLVVILAGCFRLVWFDLLINNPRGDSNQLVGSVFLLNGLALTYLLPLLWLYYARKLAAPMGGVRLQQGLLGLMVLLGFVFANFTVRYAFHGQALAVGPTSNGELYTYSALWLLLALALLVQGTRRASKPIRVVALLLMLATIGKVFLIDAGELTGLWRVFSFLGLGVCLIGLSWFYTRIAPKGAD
jgi:uncharacterized membrane protein